MKNYIIIALSAVVMALAGYMLYNSYDGDMSEAEVQSQYADLKNDYEFLQKDLETKVKALDTSDKTILAQQQKMEVLMKKNSLTEEELFEAKKIMKSISQKVYDNYRTRVADLEKEKLGLEAQTQNNEMQLKKLNSKVAVLEHAKQEINNKYLHAVSEAKQKDKLLSYAANLKTSNFVLRSFRVKINGKEVETDKAARIDKIKGSFDINENRLASTGRKELYIIVHNPEGRLQVFNNKVSGTFLYGGKWLTFSDKFVVDYQKGEEKTVDFEWDGEDFQRGDYVLEVYEKLENHYTLIGRATKSLQ